MSPRDNPADRDQSGHDDTDQPGSGVQPGEPDWYAPFTPDADFSAAPAPSYLPPWPGPPGAAPPAIASSAAGPFPQGPYGGPADAAGPPQQGPYGGAPEPVGSSAQGPMAQGPYGGAPDPAGPYAQSPYAQGPYAQGPYGGPPPNFPMGPPGWQGRMLMGGRPVGAYLRRRAITHIIMGFILLFIGIAITAGSYAGAANDPNGGPYFVTWGLIIVGVFWIIAGFARLARSSRLP